MGALDELFKLAIEGAVSGASGAVGRLFAEFLREKSKSNKESILLKIIRKNQKK